MTVIERAHCPLWLGFTLLLVAGCASTSAVPGFEDVATTVRQRTGYVLQWNQAAPDSKAQRTVKELLAGPLTVDRAVQVALLNNPSLQALYEDLSLAQADVVQAGLLSNPVVSADVTTAERYAIDPNLIAGITQSFLDLILIPAKRSVAAAQFDAAKFKVSSSVLEMVMQVKTAFYFVEAAEQTLAVRKTIAEAEEASFELAKSQEQVGNISGRSALSQQVLFLQARLDAIRSEADVAARRERLTRLMGLTNSTWHTPGRLPDVPSVEPPVERLEERALHDRLDLAALRQEAVALDSAIGLAKTSRWTGIIDIGADVARLNDGNIAVGPRASISLPIFDQRQAPIGRLEARLRACRQLLAAATIDTMSDVRAARDRVNYARETAEQYRASIIPVREQVVELSQREYDAALLDVFQLIAAKENEVTAYREYIEAVRDYWIARAELERVVTGPIAGGSKS